MTRNNVKIEYYKNSVIFPTLHNLSDYKFSQIREINSEYKTSFIQIAGFINGNCYFFAYINEDRYIFKIDSYGKIVKLASCPKEFFPLACLDDKLIGYMWDFRLHEDARELIYTENFSTWLTAPLSGIIADSHIKVAISNKGWMIGRLQDTKVVINCGEDLRNLKKLELPKDFSEYEVVDFTFASNILYLISYLPEKEREISASNLAMISSKDFIDWQCSRLDFPDKIGCLKVLPCLNDALVIGKDYFAEVNEDRFYIVSLFQHEKGKLYPLYKVFARKWPFYDCGPVSPQLTDVYSASSVEENEIELWLSNNLVDRLDFTIPRPSPDANSVQAAMNDKSLVMACEDKLYISDIITGV